MREIELMKKDILLFIQKVQVFEEKLSKVELETKDSVQLVSDLDNVKTKMELCIQIFNEADRYKSLVKDIDKIFEKQDFEQIATTLAQVEKSLSVLSAIPEYSDAVNSIEKYTQKLESTIRPKLLQSFNQHNVDEALKYIAIFEQIGRKEKVLSYYYSCKLVEIMHYWDNFDKQATSFVLWFPTFFDELELLINNERSWTAQVFSSHYEVVASLVLKIFSDIKVSFHNRLKQENISLENLIVLYKKTKDFIGSLNFLDLIEKEELKSDVIKSILAPFFPLQGRYYIKKEQEQLQQELEDIKPVLGDFMDTTSNIVNSIPKLFLLCDKSVDRCIVFTDGTEMQDLMELIRGIFKNYLSLLNETLKHLRGIANLEIVPLNKTDDQFHDWGESYFQGALKFLEIINSIISRLENFDQQLKIKFLNCRHIFTSGLKEIRSLKDVNSFHLTTLEKAQALFSYFHKLDDGTI
eukprot:TRINITY_DN5776_c0_g1_i2.p1 TRINITY_DN5776_c0_g1~~TRINITY_DN5776_c0_g1_i2.p1  ORF type:complete len:537 (+),score=140.02 TRINITY_DN5776_c0_g1_i2:214-1611(+)